MIHNLKRLRERDHITQQQLAAAVGVSQQSINKYENHNIEPDLATLIAIADYFHTSVDDLVGHSFVPSEAGFSQEEMEIIRKYRYLTEAQKESIRLILHNYTYR